MASAQVLPNSAASVRKQGHLELGKKKLEEFRKKKAAKKVASGGQLQSAGASHRENIPEISIPVKGETASTGNVANNSSTIVMHESRTKSSDGIDSLNGLSATLTAQNSDNNTSQGNSLEESVMKTSNLHVNTTFPELANGYYDHRREDNHLSHMKDSKIMPIDGFPSGVGRKPSDNYMHTKPSVPPMSTPEKYGNHSAQNSLELPITSLKASEIYEVEATEQPNNRSNVDKFSMENNSKGGKIADAINRHLNFDDSYRRVPGPSSTAFGSGFGPSSIAPTTSGYGTTSIRSRPSFLDSLGVARVSSVSNLYRGEPDKRDPTTYFDSSKFNSPEIKLLTSVEEPSLDSISNEQSIDVKKVEFPSEKESLLSTSAPGNDGYPQNQGVKDDSIKTGTFLHQEKDSDFAALEQHIEDLTKEKFSMQRALETAQALAESLAAENSSLTDSFNQQGKVVQQLKSDMERLQEEIKAQLLVLESMKLEYTNAQLECSAADERAKILASEVITLEEKALRLRSNELKLERQLDETNSEIASYKRKFSVLEKERQDLQSTVDALQEEKKLMQSKLRKASTNEKSKDIVVTSTKRDMSTSTEDLASSSSYTEPSNHVATEIGDPGMRLNNSGNSVQGPSVTLSTDTYQSYFLPEDRGPALADASPDLPQDQLKIVDNIKSLISELAVEKEELVQALRIESSNCSKLKELNKDLSQKLEIQTQRLELSTSQRLANENILAKPIDIRSSNDATEYADEGDEVVERVLGWIMKLFPGGPAKRRTSKLL